MSQRYGSDIIVELLAEAGIEYVAFNPGASFRGIHDSLVFYGHPTIIQCLHESVSVAVAQGYAKATGKPMAVLLHNVVGLQNASMAIYNAWCDRVPMLLLGGTGPLSKATRRPWIDWIHTAAMQAEIVRNYVKWDDQPYDVASVRESFARALRMTTSEPAGPVYLCYDTQLQESVMVDGKPDWRELSIFPEPAAPGLTREEVRWLADLVARAQRPVFLTGYVGDRDEGFSNLAALAELVGAAVYDTAVRCSIPSRHECNVTGMPGFLEEADLVVVFDADDPEGELAMARAAGAEPTVVVVGLGHLRARGWSHDYQAYPRASRFLTASAATAVTALLAELRSTATIEERERWAIRRAQVAERTREARFRWCREAATHTASDCVPVDRMIAEVGKALEGNSYVLANGTNERLEHRLWDLHYPRQHCGWHGGGGLGYGLGAAIGVSLGAGADVITVDVQADGDLLFTPGALWTMAHLSLPILIIVNNNRQYANSAQHAYQVASARSRRVDRIDLGTSLANPPVDVAGLARSFGLWAAGPIDSPDRLAETLVNAVTVVKSGRPALLDVLTPPYAPKLNY